MKRVLLAATFLTLLPAIAGAQIKITNLPNATTPLVGNELIPLVQGGVTDKTTAQAIANLAPGVAPIANLTILGNNSGIAAPPSALSPAQITAMLSPFTTSLQGLVPGSGGGSTNFLRADGTWALPPGGSGCTLSLTANNGLTAGTNPVLCATTTTIGLAPIGTNTVLGNAIGGTNVPQALTQAQLTALIQPFTTGLSGAAPASGGGATNFLRADGTWAAPAGACSFSLTAGQGITFGSSPIGCATTTTISEASLPNPQTVSSYSFVNGDGSKVVSRSNASAMTDLLPAANSGGNFASGWSTCVVNQGPALETITPTTSTINGATSLWLSRGQFACIASDGVNYLATVGAAMSATDAITAHAGGGQGSATQLTSTVNHVTVVATAADSVKLPATFAGEGPIVVINDTATDMQVFGAGTDTINNVATATGVSQKAGITTLYSAPVSGKWYATSLASGGGGSVTSVAMTVPAWLTVAGSPITVNGTLAVTATGAQTANNFLVTPDGSPGAVGLRPMAVGDLPSGIAFTNVAQSFTKAQRGTPIALSISGSTYTPNFDNAQNFSLTLVHASCPCTVANPSTTPVAGQSGMLVVTQSVTGSDTIGTWGSQYKFANATPPTLTSSSSAQDFFPYYVFDATHIIVGSGVLNAH